MFAEHDRVSRIFSSVLELFLPVFRTNRAGDRSSTGMNDVALSDRANVHVDSAHHFLSVGRFTYQLEELGIDDEISWHALLRWPLPLRRIFSLRRERLYAPVAEDSGNKIFRFDRVLRPRRPANDLDRVGLGLAPRSHANDLNGQLRDVILGSFSSGHLPSPVSDTESILHGER